MPWEVRDAMSLRHEFVELASQEGANRRALCRRYGISAKTGYKWLARYAAQGIEGLLEHSRRPCQSPTRSASQVEQAVIALRREQPTWGGRKISRRLRDLGQAQVAPSTVTEILRRHGLLGANPAAGSPPWQRFEHAAPNELWQIDFKGYFETPAGRCHPLTLLDDHSRFNLLLAACGQTRYDTVRPHLIEVFRRYGLPVRINSDNGAPWGAPSGCEHGLSHLSVWLIRLGIRISHSRPYHPQSNGKDERFHRSLQHELLAGRSFENLEQAQRAFDGWRRVYNQERPHDALALATPISRYRPSPRLYPEDLPAIEYGPDDETAVPGWNGEVKWRGLRFKVSSALKDLPIALRPRPDADGVFDLFFCHHRFAELSLSDQSTRA